MMLQGQQTQLFAMASILKSWEMKIAKKLQMGRLKTHEQHKNALLGHMRSLFSIDDSFDKLKSRECYNSIVGALTQAGVPTSCKEVYTAKEVAFIESRGISCEGVHVI